MGKTKSAAPEKASKSAKETQVKSLSSVKDGAVTKASQTPKAKSKEMAKQVASKANGVGKHDKKSKKIVKEPTPDPSSDDEEDSSESDEAESASSASSDDSEMEVDKKVSSIKAASKDKGTAKAASDDEDDSSESSESSDDETDGPAGQKITVGAKAESDSEDDSEDDDSEDDDEDTVQKGAVNAKALNGKLEKVASKEASSDEDSDESESESGSGSGSGSSDDEDEDDSSDSSEEEKVVPKKRKAEAESTPVAKKTKTDGLDDAAKKNLFVGRLSWNVDEEWLTREFEKFGELTRVKVMTDRDSGRSKGFGYVEFANPEDGIKAQQAMHEVDIDGRNINVDFSQPKDSQTPRQDRAKQYGDNQPSEPSSTLFVANLAFDADNDVVGEEFGKHGNVIGVRLPTDKDTGNPKGFGYVELSSIEEAQKVFGAMTGATIMGRPIRLDYSSPRPPRESNGFSAGRGGGGRGRGGFDRGGRGGGRGRGGFDRGGRGGARGGRGGSTNRGGFGDFQGKKMSF